MLFEAFKRNREERPDEPALGVKTVVVRREPFPRISSGKVRPG